MDRFIVKGLSNIAGRSKHLKSSMDRFIATINSAMHLR